MMRNWLRRLRGAIGMGLVWGFAWSLAGIVVAAVFRFQADAPFPILFFMLGFMAGVAFSLILALSAGKRRFDQMSVPRFAGWGIAGGLLLGGVFAKLASLALADVVVVVPTFALASAICASGSLALARRAVGRELPAGDKEAPISRIEPPR